MSGVVADPATLATQLRLHLHCSISDLAYFHMKSGKFWHLVMKPGFEPILAAKIKLKTFYEVKQAVNYAYLDEDLFDFLRDIQYRESLLAVLVARWFPGQLDEVKRIALTDDFQDPPGYFMEAYEKNMNRLEDA